MATDLTKRALDRKWRELAGDGPIEKQLMLLKLADLLENCPSFVTEVKAPGPEASWLAQVGAIMRRLDPIRNTIDFASARGMLRHNRQFAVNSMSQQIVDTIEELKLELELDGREEIGSAYAPGQYYDYFRDLKEIISGAERQVLIVDPYFNGDAFDEYLSDVRGVEMRVLGNHHLDEAKPYAAKHSQQHGTAIELRRSGELHDRLIIIDETDCWITGGSVKDAGKKPAYLMPMPPEIARDKLAIYADIWEQATLI